jgi:putative transcriptional regulator
MAKPTHVTNRITELRAATNMSQAELGDLIGVTRQTVNAIERSKYSPSLEAAFRIARALNVSLDNVFQYPGQFPVRKLQRTTKTRKLTQDRDQLPPTT